MLKIDQLVIASVMLIASGSVMSAVIPKFKAADADSSGFVEEAEFAAAQEAGVKEGFAELDKDGDGKLSKEEYAVVLGEDCE